MREKTNRFSFTVFAILVSITLLHCRADNLHQEKPAALLKSRLGEKYSASYNETKTYGLYQQQREGDHPKRKLKYVVVRLSDQSIVKEGSFQMGYVRWRDKDAIEVVSSSGARDDQAEKKIITIDKNHR
jgi:hypothetical protein